MEKAELKIDYTVYRESYPEGYEDLCRAALDVTKNAYCVYSVFAVGAAVLMNNGDVTPCGACRQVMTEIVQRYKADFDVIMIGKKRTLLIKASQLLPFSFVMP